MRRQLEDLHINQTKMAKAMKKMFSKPKSSRHKTKSKSRTKKRNHPSIFSSSETSSESSESKSSNSESDSEEYEINATKKKKTFSDTKKLKKHKSARPKTSSKKSSNTSFDKKSSKDARPLKIPTDNISLNAFFAILRSMVDSFTRTQPKEVSINDLIRIASQQTNILPQTAPEGSQSETEISWPNPIEINFIRKIIPNDVATICCKISSPLGKIVQVPSAMIDKSSGISNNISVMVGQGENSCTISEDFPVMDNDKPWILLGTPWLDRAG
ncbi:hypothetical protein F8M41_007012 [Gigaspora margarita]|uniref:Uncharacterized protein n=1 Tax=Gigaspora margarita TaxID=4874 RepID=A0A8H4B4G9_GIGMA|nr:hypothetical protein F8M41_007012 [Gigaspora margarita]